jgi:hypothetical protein
MLARLSLNTFRQKLVLPLLTEKRNMKNTIIQTSAAIAVALSLSLAAKANPIVGSLGINGSAVFNGSNGGAYDPTDSTMLEFLPGSVYLAPFEDTGSFAGLATGTSGDAVTFSNLVFSPPTVPTTLWSFTDSGVGGTGDTYTFTPVSVNFTSPSNDVWSFIGQGTITITGPVGNYTPTAGDYTITLSQSTSGDFFSISMESTSAAVPDSGTTALLLGLGVLAMGAYGLRRKLTRA